MAVSGPISARLDDLRLAIAILVEMHLPGEVIHAWTGGGTIDWNGHTYRGDERLMSLDKIGHDLEQSDNKVTFKMPFNPADATLCALRDGQGRGGAILIDMLFFDAATMTALGAEPCFIGEVDSCRLMAGDKQLEISLESTSETALLRRSTQHMLTDGAQQLLFPGDRGLQYATSPQVSNFGISRAGSFSGGGPSSARPVSRF